MADSTNNIVDFATLKASIEELEPLQYAEQRYDSCKHKRRTVSIEDRNVFCRDCKVELDPYKVLDEIAHEFSGWKVKQLKDEVQRLQALERKLTQKIKRRDMMTDAEKQCKTDLEFFAVHEHSPEKMYRKGDMIYCYCGNAFNRHIFPQRALEVFEAHERLAKKARFELKQWPRLSA